MQTGSAVMTELASEVSAHFTRVRTAVRTGTMLGGADPGWQAPIAVFDALSGFGEAAWVDALETTTIAIRIAGAPVVCRTRVCPGRTSGVRRNVGVQPAGSTNAATCSGRVRFAHLYLPDHLVDRVGDELGRSGVSGALRDDLWFVEDNRLEQLVSDYVSRGLDFSLPPTRLEMEARSVLVLEHLITRHHSNIGTHSIKGGLTAWAVSRVVDRIKSEISLDHSVAELAANVGLSPSHFARAFKRSTGLTPHAFQRQARCDHARHLLESTPTSITDVATAVGYETPQAFARMFRIEVGASPRDYRSERKR